MKARTLWIVLYHHRHGTDAWPMFQAVAPTEAAMIKDLDDWEPDREEYVEALGPFPIKES